MNKHLQYAIGAIIIAGFGLYAYSRGMDAYDEHQRQKVVYKVDGVGFVWSGKAFSIVTHRVNGHGVRSKTEDRHDLEPYREPELSVIIVELQYTSGEDQHRVLKSTSCDQQMVSFQPFETDSGEPITVKVYKANGKDLLLSFELTQAPAT